MLRLDDGNAAEEKEWRDSPFPDVLCTGLIGGALFERVLTPAVLDLPMFPYISKKASNDRKLVSFSGSVADVALVLSTLFAVQNGFNSRRLVVLGTKEVVTTQLLPAAPVRVGSVRGNDGTS